MFDVEAAAKLVAEAGWVPVDQMPEEWRDGCALIARLPYMKYGVKAHYHRALGLRDADGSPIEGFCEVHMFPRYPDPLASTLTAALEEIRVLREENDQLIVQFDRSARLIERMADYIGKMALNADDLADLNEHWCFVERRRREARALLDGGEHAE